MKALTLTQPWATCIADGKKNIETRDWKHGTRNLIGQRIAIHAGKKVSPEYAEDFGYRVKDLPSGAVVCTARLEGVFYVLHLSRNQSGVEYATCKDAFDDGPVPNPFDVRTDKYGNFGLGRYLFYLTDIRPLTPPVPARGYQKLWEWTPPC